MATDPVTSELRELLAVERDCCIRMLPLLDAERAAAAAYDHAGLVACLREREMLQAELQRAADARRERQQGLGRPLAALRADDPELATLLHETARAAAVVRRAQRINEGVVRAALAHVSDLLAVMRRAHPDSRYDGRAALTGATAASSGARWSA
jgi:flagellar biosynthesis/type III secretory pathway chaperone